VTSASSEWTAPAPRPARARATPRLAHLQAAKAAREHREALRALVDAGYMPLSEYLALFPEPAAARHPPLTRAETADHRLPAAALIREAR